MKIRTAQSVDLELLVKFQLQMALETENVNLDASTLKRGINSLLNDPARGKYFIVEIDKKPVACTMITPEWSDWRCGWIIWLQSVYVLPEYRKQGVFKAMYSYIKDIVDTNMDYRGIRLYVDNTNLLAQKVYKHLGMNGEHYNVWEWMK
jgi:GNAT superfamily N-acetyltransferase